MKTLKDYEPMYVELREKYANEGKKAPGALAFRDVCDYYGKHPDEAKKAHDGRTMEDGKECTRLLEESFSNEDLELLSVIGWHQIQRGHYRNLLKNRLAEASKRVG